MVKAKKVGQCKCGAVKFFIKRAPIFTVACHCSKCRTSFEKVGQGDTKFNHFSAYWGWDFYIKGPVKRTMSSVIMSRGHCKECNDRITDNLFGGLVSTAAGSISGVPPAVQVFYTSGTDESHAQFKEKFGDVPKRGSKCYTDCMCLGNNFCFPSMFGDCGSTCYVIPALMGDIAKCGPCCGACNMCKQLQDPQVVPEAPAAVGKMER